MYFLTVIFFALVENQFCVSGYLDSSSINEHLVPGTKVEMPFWMARALCSRKRHIVSVDTPKNYKDSYREILTADANVVDLHKLGPYYYCFGTHLLKFEQPESADIAKSLVKVRKFYDTVKM